MCVVSNSLDSGVLMVALVVKGPGPMVTAVTVHWYT